MLELNYYQNMNTESKNYGMYYVRKEPKQVMDLTALAEHMAEHNTPFSKGTIKGILTDMVSCIRELTLNGNTVKIANLAIFKASVQSNPCSRYAVMRATIGSKSVKVGGQTVETGNAVKSMKLLAQATGAYSKAELNKAATLGWTMDAQTKIDADKAVMAQANNG